jgi:hypothetical protein
VPVDARYDYKRIADPVHGTIGLSSVEVAVINTAAFQRLHDVDLTPPILDSYAVCFA